MQSESALRWKKFAALNLLALLLAVLTLFMAGPILRVLHRSYPRKYYWIVTFTILAVCFAIGLHPLSFLITSCFILIGLYGEFELRGRAGFTTALLSSVTATIFLCAGFLWTFQSFGINLEEQMTANFQALLQSWKSSGMDPKLLLGVESEVFANNLYKLLPAFMTLMMIFVLAMSFILDRRVAELARIKWNKIASQMNLYEFRAPDYFIWVLMISFLLSFLDIKNPEISIVARNIFLVSMGVYFMQALAVVESLFLYFRIGIIWKLLFYLLVVGQGVLLLMIAGIIDYWVDFRRWVRRRKNSQKQRNL